MTICFIIPTAIPASSFVTPTPKKRKRRRDRSASSGLREAKNTSISSTTGSAISINYHTPVMKDKGNNQDIAEAVASNLLSSRRSGRRKVPVLEVRDELQLHF